MSESRMEKKSVVMSENQNFLRVRINLFASFTFPELLRSNVYELRGTTVSLGMIE